MLINFSEVCCLLGAGALAALMSVAARRRNGWRLVKRSWYIVALMLTAGTSLLLNGRPVLAVSLFLFVPFIVHNLMLVRIPVKRIITAPLVHHQDPL